MGRMSPTMARPKNERKQSREQLVQAVRKHFNSMAVVENDVMVDLLYNLRTRGMPSCRRPIVRQVLNLTRTETHPR